MGLFGSLRENRKKRLATHKAEEFWELVNSYRPVFSSYNGNMYEMATVRAAINANATHRSKLSVEITGPLYKDLAKQLTVRANPYQTTSQFLAKVSTILDTENSCIIVPLYDSPYSDHICGFWPVHPQAAEIVNYNNTVYIKYQEYGVTRSIEYDRCGVMVKMSYKNGVFGDSNAALYPTLDLINIHNDRIREAVKSSATIRFLVKLTNVFKDDTIKAERERFMRENLSAESNGVMLIDKKYEDVKQIDSRPVVVDHDQLSLINENVRDYFGISDSIIQNKFTSEEWSAYYEGNTEPFAIQLSQVLSSMLFTADQIANGSMLYMTANRLQYASNKEKIDIITSLFDRGMLTTNQGLDIFNMAHLEGPDGDKRYIRKDYIDLSLLGAEIDTSLIDDKNKPKKEENEDADEK
jgi:hypothetical protein